ncbi:MAG: sigma-54 dependent transcriptional regulator [Desulfobacterales bacterium]|nr:sigma-54 dependent transcriptional regulator [Desulfobacterales bacterium]
MKHIPETRTPILIVDDDVTHLLSVKALLKDSDIPGPALVSDSREVLPLIREHGFIFVLLDLLMPHMDGMALLKEIKQQFPDVECVVLTAIDDTASAVKAMKYGAYDYMVKPFSRDKLIITIHRALERYTLRKGMAVSDRPHSFSDLRHPEAFKDMVTRDKTMARVFLRAEVVAPTQYSVIISGESGTGKEMLARALHRASRRADAPFVAVNMGAFNAALFESEFFGSSKGAYTGASEKKEGFLEAARGGTLFLDEITDLDISRQGVLLRVLQEKEFYRIGSTRKRTVDVRILAATNRDIELEVQKGRFRADLYHRLNMYQISIPRLADRKADISLLAAHFIKAFARENNKPAPGLSTELERHLTAYDFPGNVRELRNIIASAVLLETGPELSPASLPEPSPVHGVIPEPVPDFPGGPDRDLPPLSEIEKQYICKVLSAVDNNRTRAARILGIGLRTLQRKLKSFGTTSK